MRVLSEFAHYWCIVWVGHIMTSGGQGWKMHASKVSRKVPKKGCKTYSVQYIYSIYDISILAGFCQNCHPVLGVLLYESLTISGCFAVGEYQFSSHFARLHATLRCNARKRRMHIFVSKIALLIHYDDIIQVKAITAWVFIPRESFHRTPGSPKNHFNKQKRVM